ncbi:hypothetical protein IKW75_02585 [Candidatus Saccharibacteria bacterium]|nr:hypothetical protein [Candidatus Saccharibacteria bacterium]
MSGVKQNSKYLQQVSDNETAVILSELRDILARGVAGDAVEFGCYRGDTSLLLERILEREFPDTESRLWIYDSFEGLPDRTSEDASVAGDGFKAGELFVTKREVMERFKKSGLKVPRVRKGFFENLDPATDLPEKICFAFLDGDLYQSIKTSLELITPKMTRDGDGQITGTIIVHDYNNPQLPGSARAVDEWIAKISKDQKTAPRLERRESLAIITF